MYLIFAAEYSSSISLLNIHNNNERLFTGVKLFSVIKIRISLVTQKTELSIIRRFHNQRQMNLVNKLNS